MDAERADHLDLTSRVLQHTLAEVSHGTPGAGAGAGAAAAGHDAAAHERCCVICLEAVSEACEARPCRHADFDYLCLLSWLEQQARCPLCKAEVAEVRHGWDGAAWRQTYAVPPPPPPPPKRAVPAPPPRRPRPPVRNGTSYAAPPPPPRPRPHHQQQPLPWGRPEAESEADARRRDERAVRVRRDVYRQQLYSLHMGSNRYSQYRDLTPALFERDAALVSRARTWLRRELRVFEFLHPAPPPPPPPETPPAAAGGHGVTTRRRANNAEFLLEYIVAILKTVDIQGSKGQAEDMLQEFLGRENARLLLHELRSFLRSPHSIEAWDRHVQYPSARKRRRSELGHDDDDGDDDATAEQSYAGGSEQAPRARGDFYRPSY